MDSLRVDQQLLPPRFYRIQYDGCRTVLNEMGLWSMSMDTLDTAANIVSAIQHQLNWYNRQPTPFISVFEDKERAENWALSLRNDNIVMAEVDTSLLQNVVAFPLERARQLLNADISRQPQHNSEWLVLHHISAAAIRRWIGRDALETRRDIRQEGREEARVERRRHRWRMQNDPLYHYVPELGGWYDEDEEAEERNIADDIIKLIEDNW